MPKLKQFNDKEFNINVAGKNIIFSNNPASKTYIKNRMDRMLSKEPETIKWMNNFDSNTIFFDIGANIGIYTLYSAIVKSNTVYAFEPHSASYKNLLDSINANKLQNCYAYCIALSDKINLNNINVKNMHEGVAENIVGEKGDYYHGCVEFNLDFLVSRKILPQPDCIKIDVDGFEDKVIEGGMNTFKNCKSILIEINNKHRNYVEMIKALGFNLSGQYQRNDHEFNYIFTQ